METKLTDKTLIAVYNNSDSSVGYTINQGAGSISRRWHATGVKKDIELGELKAIMDEPGGRELFVTYDKELRKTVDSYLLIKNNQVRKILDFPELNEYVLEPDDIKELFNSSDSAKFEDILSNCSTTLLELIYKLAVDENLQDMNKLKLISDYSGFNIIDVIKNKIEEKSQENKSVETTTVDTNVGRKKKSN